MMWKLYTLKSKVMEVQIGLVLVCIWILPASAIDCSREVQSKNISTACHMDRGVTGCNIKTLSEQHPLMFNHNGWAQPPPEFIRATTFCRPDKNGLNRSGVFLHWKLPEHQGAMGIKGFLLTLELHRPDYRCFVIKLKEHVTQNTTGSVFNITIYPIATKKNFLGLVYSLPRTKDSENQTHMFKSSKCDNPNTSGNWYPKHFNICYYEDTKELNVSFESPPTHFLFDKFTIVISQQSTGDLMDAHTNTTYHVFQSVEHGLYQIAMQPYDPNSNDHIKCKCRDEQNRCTGCIQLRSNYNVSKYECERPWISPPPTTLASSISTKQKLTNGERDRIITLAVSVPIGLLGTLLLVYFLKRRFGCKGSCLQRDKRTQREAPPMCHRNGPSKQCIVILDLTGVKGDTDTNPVNYIQRLLTKLKLTHVDKHTITAKDLQHDLACDKITVILRNFQSESNSPKGNEETVKLSDIAVKQEGNVPPNCDKVLDNAHRMLLCFAISNETDTQFARRFVKRLDDILNSGLYNTLRFKSISVSYGFVSKDSRVFAPECQYYNMSDSNIELCSELRTFLNVSDQVTVEQEHGSIADDAIEVAAGNTPDAFCGTDNPAETQEKIRAQQKTAQWLIENNLNVPKRDRFFSSDSGRGPSENSFKSSPDDSHENVYESLLPREEDPPRPLYDVYEQCGSNVKTNVRFEPGDKCPSEVTFFAPSVISESDTGDVLTDAKGLALQDAYRYYNGDSGHLQYYANHQPRYPNGALRHTFSDGTGFHGGYIHNPYDYHHIHSDLAYRNDMLERNAVAVPEMRVEQDDSDISAIMDQMKALNERNSSECKAQRSSKENKDVVNKAAL